MIIVTTGMVGLDKKSYLESAAALCAENGKKVTLCNIGDLMYAEAPDIKPGRILDISLKRLHGLRRSVFKDIIAKSKSCKNLIVNTHATFRWQHGLFPAVDFDQMRQLNADMYICLVDSVGPLHVRLNKEHQTKHTLKDLIVWREEEILGTEMLCKGIDDSIPFYCLARGAVGETIDTFYKLIFEPGIKKAYLSFPMTHVFDMPEIQKTIDEFRNACGEIFTCFDPGDLEEAYFPTLAAKAEEQGLDFVEMTALGKKTKFDLQQVKQITRDINSQIYARDFMLIDQSDMIISFIPELADGSAIISSGVERELQHAHEAAKEVYVIWTAKKAPSVFVTQTATKVFRDLEQAKQFFKQKGYTQ